MTYHPLTQESGGDELSRIQEARTIVRMLEECSDEMTERQRDFVNQMANSDYCSTKQLFWLRDLKDRYL